MTRPPDTPENEHERIQVTKRTQEVIENKAAGIAADERYGTRFDSCSFVFIRGQ